MFYWHKKNYISFCVRQVLTYSYAVKMCWGICIGHVRGAHVRTVPNAAQSTIKMTCRLEENLGRWDVCDRANLGFINSVLHQSMSIFFFTPERSGWRILHTSKLLNSNQCIDRWNARILFRNDGGAPFFSWAGTCSFSSSHIIEKNAPWVPKFSSSGRPFWWWTAPLWAQFPHVRLGQSRRPGG